MNGTATEPFDPGLQAERTLLAWRRTCLSLAVASAIIVRFASETIGAFAAVLGIAGVVGALWGYIRVARRYRRAHEGLSESGRLPIDGLALGVVSLTLLLIGFMAVIFVFGAGDIDTS